MNFIMTKRYKEIHILVIFFDNSYYIQSCELTVLHELTIFYITKIRFIFCFYHYYFMVLLYSATTPTISLIFSNGSPYLESATYI